MRIAVSIIGIFSMTTFNAGANAAGHRIFTLELDPISYPLLKRAGSNFEWHTSLVPRRFAPSPPCSNLGERG